MPAHRLQCLLLPHPSSSVLCSWTDYLLCSFAFVGVIFQCTDLSCRRLRSRQVLEWSLAAGVRKSMAFGFKLSTGGKEGPRDIGETFLGGGSHVSVTGSCYGKLSQKLRIFITGGYGNQGFGPSLHDNEEGGGLDGRSTIELTALGRRLRGFPRPLHGMNCTLEEGHLLRFAIIIQARPMRCRSKRSNMLYFSASPVFDHYATRVRACAYPIAFHLHNTESYLFLLFSRCI